MVESGDAARNMAARAVGQQLTDRNAERNMAMCGTEQRIRCVTKFVLTLLKTQRWAGRVARMGGGEAYTGFWWGNLREGDHLGDPGVDGRIILRWIFRKWDVGLWNGSSWLRIGTGGGHL